MMNKIAVTLLAGSLALGGLGLANADNDRYEKGGYHGGKHCHHTGMRGEHRLERMTEKLGLSEEQVSQIKAIQEKYASQKQGLRKKMHESRQQLRKAMHADTMDQAKVKQLAEVIGSLKTEKILMKSKIHSEVSQVLTSEQRMKRKSMHEQRGEKRHGYKEGYDS